MALSETFEVVGEECLCVRETLGEMRSVLEAELFGRNVKWNQKEEVAGMSWLQIMHFALARKEREMISKAWGF